LIYSQRSGNEFAQRQFLRNLFLPSISSPRMH
jgi:hypothetical protein